MLKLTTEAQSTQSFALEMLLCDLCASVFRNRHDERGKLFQTRSLVVLNLAEHRLVVALANLL